MKRVLILDLNYHLNRSVHVKALAQLQDATGRKTGGVFGLLNTIQVCLRRCAPVEKVIGVWDGGHSARRLALFPPDTATMTGYKVSRGLHPNLTEDERAEKEELYAVLETARQISTPLLMNSGVHVIRWPEREADDVIDVIARRLEPDYDQVIIASDDWDFAQCCSEKTCVFRPMKDEFLSLHNFVELLDVPVDWFTLRKAVIGKKGDDVPGLRGVGPVYIAKAIREYIQHVMPPNVFDGSWYDAHQYRTTRPADLTPFYDFCAADRRKKFQTIGNGRDDAEFNIELVDFTRESLPDEHVAMVMAGIEKTHQFDEMEVVRQFGELNIQTLLENFARWSEPFRRIS